MWPAALTSPWEAVWCSELSCGWVLWSFSLELLVASKLVPDTCGCISSLRPHDASSLPSSPGYGHLKSHSTSPEQPPEVSSVFFSACFAVFLQVKSQSWYMLWPCTDALSEDISLKRQLSFSASCEVWMKGCKLLLKHEQDPTIWTVRMRTSRFSFIPVSSLSNLELTECWKATNLSGLQTIWLWINPGT